MRIVQIKIGYSKEKMMPVPIEIRGNGYRKEKSFVVPKEKRENGYRREKCLVVPKEKRGNGYREEKEFLIPISKGILIWELKYMNRFTVPLWRKSVKKNIT